MPTFLEEFAKFRTPEQIVKDALLHEISNIWNMLTEPQQNKCKLIFKGDLEKLSENELRAMVDVIHR